MKYTYLTEICCFCFLCLPARKALAMTLVVNDSFLLVNYYIYFAVFISEVFFMSVQLFIYTSHLMTSVYIYWALTSMLPSLHGLLGIQKVEVRRQYLVLHHPFLIFSLYGIMHSSLCLQLYVTAAEPIIIPTCEFGHSGLAQILTCSFPTLAYSHCNGTARNTTKISGCGY